MQYTKGLTCHKPISLLQLQDTSFESLDKYVTNLYSSRGMEDRLENDDDNGSVVGLLVPKSPYYRIVYQKN